MDYSYKGLTVSEETYKQYKALEGKGTCPLCGKAGLSNRYDSRDKHIKTCAAKVRK